MQLPMDRLGDIVSHVLETGRTGEPTKKIQGELHACKDKNFPSICLVRLLFFDYCTQSPVFAIHSSVRAVLSSVECPSRLLCQFLNEVD